MKESTLDWLNFGLTVVLIFILALILGIWAVIFTPVIFVLLKYLLSFFKVESTPYDHISPECRKAYEEAIERFIQCESNCGTELTEKSAALLQDISSIVNVTMSQKLSPQETWEFIRTINSACDILEKPKESPLQKLSSTVNELQKVQKND